MKDLKLNILFGFLLLCLLLHLAFSPLHIIKDLPLNGYYEKPTKGELTAENYFTHKFQDSTEKYIKYNFGLFPGFTRINHQLEYSLFDQIHVSDVHRGNNEYLFRYCPGCMSENKFASEHINKFIDHYSKFKDSVTASGKSVLWVIAPDKNMVFSEFLSASVGQPTEVNGYYWDLKRSFKQKGIEVIDFNELAFREKNKYPFAVCTKGGVHWTQPYAARCFDSLCNYLSETTSISIKNSIDHKKTGNPWDPDYDIEKSANLLIPLENKENCYFSNIISISNAKNKKILLIGDSFCHAWMWNKWFKNCFSAESEFWYYNRESQKLDNTFIKNLDHQHVRKYISKFDSFIFVFSAANAEMLDYNFMNDLYK